MHVRGRVLIVAVLVAAPLTGCQWFTAHPELNDLPPGAFDDVSAVTLSFGPGAYGSVWVEIRGTSAAGSAKYDVHEGPVNIGWSKNGMVAAYLGPGDYEIEICLAAESAGEQKELCTAPLSFRVLAPDGAGKPPIAIEVTREGDTLSLR